MEITFRELESATDLDLGEGPWHAIEQSRIDTFADATDDHQWIHTDPEKARTGPFGKTVAHGYLTLSLVPSLLAELLTVTGVAMTINYGLEKLRFPAPVPVGSEVRLRAKILGSEPRKRALLYRLEAEVEVQGNDRPALSAELLYLAMPQPGA